MGKSHYRRILDLLGKGRIGRRLVVTTILFSSCITLLTTSYQLYLDYKKDIASIDRYFELIQDSYLESLTASVWMYDEKQIATQLDGLTKIPDIEHLGITAGDDHEWSAGARNSKYKITRRFPLIFRHRNHTYDIGLLRVTASLDNVYDRLIGKAFSILVTNAIRAFFVSCFILYIFHLLVTRRLVRLSEQVKHLDLDARPVDLGIAVDTRRDSLDEIDLVVHALDQTQHKLFASHEALRHSVKELEDAHSRFLTVLDAIDAHIYVADMETHEILFMNSKMQKDFGGDLTGSICWQTFRGESGPCPHCTNDRLVDTNGEPGGVVTWQGENPLTKKWYINHDRAIRWVDGKLVRIQIAVDISQHKKMEEELRQAHKMEAVGTLAGGIAHDFNNILGIIVGNTELALEDIPEWNPARSNLEEVKTASLRARNVVQQLLSFSRKSKHKKTPLILASVIDESMKLLRASIPKDIAIQTDIQASRSIVRADPTQIQQVLINLCTNAAHAMEERGGVLKVALKQKAADSAVAALNTTLPPGRYVQLAITDTGTGIAPDILKKVFDPYFTTKEVGKGSGLGLAIVHGIAENHDGGILIHSTPGAGTTVELLFPEDETGSLEAPEPPQTLHLGNERVLLVDDEAPILNVVRQMLQRLGYAVTAQSDPVQALSEFSEAPDAFDVIVTDMTMPNMSGAHLARQIRAVKPETPIIICTGYSEKIDPLKASAIGIDGFLMKPIVKTELAAMIRNVLHDGGSGDR